jgi:acetylornithine deacetylase
MSERLFIIKIGGNVIDDETKLSSFLKDFSRIRGKKILVHGGGKLATRIAEQLNIPQQIIEGRRITDAETLKIVTMVYAGYIKKNIVAGLQSYDCNALGLTGADGDSVFAHRRQHPAMDYGFAGDIDGINSALLTSLIEQNITIVFAPITHDKKGQLLNTNADTIAQELAKGLSGNYEVELVYLFEKPGVLQDANDDRSVLNRIDHALYQKLKKEEKIFAGMIPKLDNAFAALESGVKKVNIGKAEDILQIIAGVAGTMIGAEGTKTKPLIRKTTSVMSLSSKSLPFTEDLDLTSVISLLKELISTPSFSKEEAQAAGIIMRFLEERGLQPQRAGNNIFMVNEDYDAARPTLLLNSHHDTVKPNKGYTVDPFAAIEKDGKLFGLGSNDAGGCLVALIAVFIHFYKRKGLKYNLALAATAEEEISGTGGIEEALKHLPVIDCAIVGEPTKMQMAIAEKGLVVLDCISSGKAGHAAREEGENAIHNAMQDIEWFRSFQFPRVSELLGPVKMSVTAIETANKTHNIVPSECRFIADVRVNELYTLDEIVKIIKGQVKSEVYPRSTRLRSTAISLDHPLVIAGLELGRTCFGSPTTSDKALMPFPALKMGPGDSARSHMADEYIYVDEIKEGIHLYKQVLERLL